VYCLGAPKPVSFSNFLGEIARSRLRCCRAYIPVPVVLIRGISKLIGKRRATQLGLERLDSLFVLPFMATESDLGKLKLALRPLDAGMHPSGDDRRRRLMREGRSLLAYIMKELPSGVLLRRYVRAMEHLRGGESVGLPETFLRCPILLSLLHPSDWSDKPSGAEFIWRLDSATTLAEATPSGAIRFIGVGCVQGYWASLYSVMTAVICEFVWRFVRLSLLPFIRRALKRKKDI
jgi:NADH dehydrogenase